jgi:hypothetical protein
MKVVVVSNKRKCECEGVGYDMRVCTSRVCFGNRRRGTYVCPTNEQAFLALYRLEEPCWDEAGLSLPPHPRWFYFAMKLDKAIALLRERLGIRVSNRKKKRG